MVSFQFDQFRVVYILFRRLGAVSETMISVTNMSQYAIGGAEVKNSGLRQRVAVKLVRSE